MALVPLEYWYQDSASACRAAKRCAMLRAHLAYFLLTLFKPQWAYELQQPQPVLFSVGRAPAPIPLDGRWVLHRP